MTESVEVSSIDAVPQHVGVLGGGRMGSGIAHAFLASGASVVVVERDEESAQAAKGRVLENVEKSLSRGKLEGALEEWANKLSVSTDYKSFAECELVIEAVPEDPQLKVEALTKVEAELWPTAWLATNTSSLSVDKLAENLKRPERFCGLHFFNPVPASMLVEVVISKYTGGRAQGLVEALG
jgi:3-hydroxybutyryl-CoA dehydrogenase